MLEGLSVLVTGASQGIGRGIALAAADAGAAVLATGIDLDGARTVADEIRAEGGRADAARCDVGSADEVGAAVARAVALYGKLDAVVHNATSAASSRPVPLEEIDESDWDDHVAVALRAVLRLGQAALPHLVGAKGSFVILTSASGVEGTATLPAYSTVKGAQRGLMRSLAREWGPLGVRVNGLAPSAVTPAVDAFLKREPDMRRHILARASLARLGDARGDIGRAVAFLLGPGAAFVSGQTLCVSGGSLMI